MFPAEVTGWEKLHTRQESRVRLVLLSMVDPVTRISAPDRKAEQRARGFSHTEESKWIVTWHKNFFVRHIFVLHHYSISFDMLFFGTAVELTIRHTRPRHPERQFLPTLSLSLVRFLDCLHCFVCLHYCKSGIAVMLMLRVKHFYGLCTPNKFSNLMMACSELNCVSPYPSYYHFRMCTRLTESTLDQHSIKKPNKRKKTYEV